MKEYESLIIGHICKDKNTDHLGHTVYAAGGAVLYSSAAAYALGHKVGALTKIGPADPDLKEAFTIPPILRRTKKSAVRFARRRARRSPPPISRREFPQRSTTWRALWWAITPPI